jgi:hypothetical protein
MMPCLFKRAKNPTPLINAGGVSLSGGQTLKSLKDLYKLHPRSFIGITCRNLEGENYPQKQHLAHGRCSINVCTMNIIYI